MVKPKHSRPVTWLIRIASDRSVQVIAGALIAVPTLLGFLVAVDARWLHAEAYAADQRQQGVAYQTILNQLEINRLSAEVNALEQQRSQVMRDVRTADKRTPQHTMQIYSVEINDLSEKIKAKSQLVDRLKTGK